MRASFRRGAAADTAADTLCVGLFEDEGVPQAIDDALGGKLARLVESGRGEGRLSQDRASCIPTARSAAARVVTVGLGKRDEFDAERARIAAAVALPARRGRRLAVARLGRAREHRPGARSARALVEGTLLAAYSSTATRAAPTSAATTRPKSSRSSPTRTSAQAVRGAAIVVECQNTARDLQNLPANALTPDGARRARARAAPTRSTASRPRCSGPTGSRELEMGGLLAVAQGSHEEPRLIVLRYDGGGGRPRLLGIVGKAVTFDTGGISIKPSGKMQEMKMDMSGGAAAIEATGRDRAPRASGQARDGRAGDREHALRPRDQARRHHHDLERQDGRGQQHRRRGPADPRRRARLRGRPRAPSGSSTSRRSPARSSSRSARPTRASSRTTTPSARQLDAASEAHRRARLADAAAPRLQGAHARQGRRPRERVRAAQGVVRLRRLVPRGVRRTASRGRTSTSPASPGTRTTATTSARARAAGACACSSTSRASGERASSRS